MPTRLAASLAFLVLVVLPSAALAGPIPPGPPTSLPAFSGAAATPQPVADPTIAPQNPFMAPNPNNNIHNDTWMTDAYQRFGPLGRNPTTRSGALPASLCGSLTFDSRGRIVTVCPSLVAPPVARIIDPRTLSVVADYTFPNAPDAPGTEPFQNFTGGGYFFLDPQDRIWSATKTSHLFVLSQSSNGRALRKTADYDLTGVLQPNERVTSALPDFLGRIWFVSKRNGKVGTLDPKSGRIRVLRLGEEVENSFAVDRGAVYIVSDRRMYRFSAGRDGRPRIDWKVTYRNSGVRKPSQVDAGSGTTPTIMDNHYVAITDNADPMNVVVYRTGRHLLRARGQRRVVCEVPVFGRGASATENSLITAGRSLVVENNYGYQSPFGAGGTPITRTGFARVDVNRRGTGCRKVWTNTRERAPSVVPKLSTRTGLVYAYTRDRDPGGAQPWFWTALDFRTGRTRFKRLSGTGLAFNNNYAGIALSSGGTAYLGVIGGIVAMRDG